LSSIYFPNPLLGWAAGAIGIMLKTTDGGNSWVTQPTNTTKNFSSVYFIDSSYGWAAGYNGLMMKTTDGGDNWFSIWNSNDEWFNTIFFHDSLNGWAGSGNKLFQTNDGGENWIINLEHGAEDIQFINISEGWFCSSSLIYITTDGGNSWNYSTTGSIHGLNSIHFTNNNTGWAVGDNGKIVKTIDGGITWVTQLSFTNSIFSSVYFFDENVGWIVGESGSILKTTNGGVTFVEQKDIDEIPTAYYLSQNYPNPFNPSTTIKFSIPSSGYATLKIYNTLGEEVAVLLNKELTSGSYEVEWNAEGLPSGVYFYQLRAEGVVETRKMLLLK
jgi:photosystem II stability/assembly factor-like uncharacterized protein